MAHTQGYNIPTSEDVQKKIVSYYEQGYTAQECADKFGVSRPTASKYVRLAGKQRTLSETCKLRDSKREHGNSWKGGRSLSYKPGYVAIYMGIKNERSFYVLEHLIIAEKALGRKLKKGEVVHHINGNGTDNRNCNLLICDRSYHVWLHNEMSKRDQCEKFR